MKFLNFRIPGEDVPLYNAYRNIVFESVRMERSPIHVGRNILILPAEVKRSHGGEHTLIYLDSRHAFRDGCHSTTVLCRTLFEEYLNSLTLSEKISFQCWI